jgi:hypothetical protein
MRTYAASHMAYTALVAQTILSAVDLTLAMARLFNESRHAVPRGRALMHRENCVHFEILARHDLCDFPHQFRIV